MSWGHKGLQRLVMAYFYLLLRLTCVIINLGTLQFHLLNTAIIRTRSERSLGAFKQSNVLPDVGDLWTEGNFTLLVVFKEFYVMS